MAAKEHDLVLFYQRRKVGDPIKRSLPLPTSADWRCLGAQDTYLSHIQQVDLQEEPQGAACQLVRGPSNCITELVANGQLLLLLWFLLGRERKTENMLRILASNLEDARSTALSPANWARSSSSTLGNPTSPTPEEVALKCRLSPSHLDPEKNYHPPSLRIFFLARCVVTHIESQYSGGRARQVGL